MRGFALALFLVLAGSSIVAADEAPARAAARRFGQALVDGRPAALSPILPERGKVRVRLTCLGFEDGSYSASQVVALLQDFLRSGSVAAFDVLRVEGDEKDYALVQGRARMTDRQGRPAELTLLLTVQPEGGRWVLREIRESPP